MVHKGGYMNHRILVAMGLVVMATISAVTQTCRLLRPVKRVIIQEPCTYYSENYISVTSSLKPGSITIEYNKHNGRHQRQTQKIIRGKDSYEFLVPGDVRAIHVYRSFNDGGQRPTVHARFGIPNDCNILDLVIYGCRMTRAPKALPIESTKPPYGHDFRKALVWRW